MTARQRPPNPQNFNLPLPEKENPGRTRNAPGLKMEFGRDISRRIAGGLQSRRKLFLRALRQAVCPTRAIRRQTSTVLFIGVPNCFPLREPQRAPT